MCDTKLGDVLDTFDALDLWKDTMLIVWTDHGFLLAEHGSWAKCWQPFYEEVSHTPFFVWDPRSGKRDERRSALVQPALDLGPTILEFFGQKPTDRMLGKNLSGTIEADQPVRDAALFGMHGMHVNVTDGRSVYMRAPKDANNSPLYEYTLMPAHMRKLFAVEELQADRMELTGPLGFTKNCKVLRIPRAGGGDPSSHSLKAVDASSFGTLLFDLQEDPRQTTPLSNPGDEARMVEQLMSLMSDCEAPPEQYERLGLAR